jgi:ribosomal protein L17
MSLFERFGTKTEYVLTTVAKAKEARGFAERIVTLGMKARAELDAAARAAGLASAEELTKAHVESDKNYAGWIADRPAEAQKKFKEHLARSLHYRRLIIQRLGTCQTPAYRSSDFEGTPPRHERAIATLLTKIAPRFLRRREENPKNQGGYTRVLKTSLWTKGDGSTRALWGFVGTEPVVAAPADKAEKKVEVGAK